MRLNYKNHRIKWIKPKSYRMKNKAILKSTQGCHGYGITQISQWWQEQEREELKLTHIEKKKWSKNWTGTLLWKNEP